MDQYDIVLPGLCCFGRIPGRAHALVKQEPEPLLNARGRSLPCSQPCHACLDVLMRVVEPPVPCLFHGLPPSVEGRHALGVALLRNPNIINKLRFEVVHLDLAHLRQSLESMLLFLVELHVCVAQPLALQVEDVEVLRDLEVRELSLANKFGKAGPADHAFDAPLDDL